MVILSINDTLPLSAILPVLNTGKKGISPSLVGSVTEGWGYHETKDHTVKATSAMSVGILSVSVASAQEIPSSMATINSIKCNNTSVTITKLGGADSIGGARGSGQYSGRCAAAVYLVKNVSENDIFTINLTSVHAGGWQAYIVNVV